MLKIDNVHDTRKTMLQLGHKPMAAIDKRCKLKNWNKLLITEALLGKWKRSTKLTATALRLDDKVMLDLDVDHPVIEDIIDAYAEAYPDLFNNEDVPLLTRGTTASRKLAFFFRFVREADEPELGIIRTRRFMPPGAASSDDAIRIEIFGGPNRYAGAIGPHDIDKGSTYRWPDDKLTAVPHTSMAPVTRKDCFRFADIAEQVMLAKGCTAVKGSKSGEHAGDWLYTITEDMTFDCDDGQTRTLDELKDEAVGEAGMRCSAAWLEGPSSVNRTRCLARTDLDGRRFYITDFNTMDKHLEAGLRPPGVADVGEQLKGLKWEDNEDGVPSARDKAEEIKESHVYCPTMKAPVIRIGPSSEGMTLTHFRTLMLPYRSFLPGPDGKVKLTNPADIWLCDPDRIEVAGIAFRPDQKERIYEEDGKRWLNSYWPPDHAALAPGGTAAPGWELVRQLAPIDSERKYFTQWLAYKFLHPDVPGPAVISIANDRFGTGRGTMKELLEKLFGRHYVRTIQFAIFAGKNYQSQYNTWMANSLIVVVNETTELSGSNRRTERHDGYAHLREAVETAATQREIVAKGINNQQMICFCTYFVATNTYDAFETPGQDRRLFGMTSGDPREPQFWIMVREWMAEPQNIAAFARELAQVDLSGYSPHAPPPMTEGKAQMVAASRSDIDIGLDLVLDFLRPRSELFSMLHILNGMRAIERQEGLQYPEHWERVMGRIVGTRAFATGKRQVNDRVKVNGVKYGIYAWTRELKVKWDDQSVVFMRLELEKAGPFDGSIGAMFAICP